MALSDILKGEYNSLVGDKKTYEKRREELIKIRASITQVCDSDVMPINQSLVTLIENIAGGLEGTDSEDAIITSLDGFKQSYHWNDSSMSSVYDAIQNEITRCENKISSLETAIRNKSTEINNAVEAEKHPNTT